MADHGLAAPRTTCRGCHSGSLSTGLSEANLVTQQSNTTIFYDPEYPDATSAEEVRVMVGSKRSAECLSAGTLEPNAARAIRQTTNLTLELTSTSPPRNRWRNALESWGQCPTCPLPLPLPNP